MREHSKNSHSGFTIWEIILLVFIIGFVAAIAIPNFNHDGHNSPGNACINNLRQIDAAANQLAIEHSLTNGSRINFPSDLTPYIKLDENGKMRSCPSGGTYHIGRVGKVPTCSLGTTVTPAHVLP